MKRLVADQVRRNWGWLLFGGLWMLLFGALTVPGATVPLPLWMLLCWMGPIRLEQELQPGSLRALRALPMSAAELGRSFWLAAVLVPWAVCTASFCLVAALRFLSHGGAAPFPWMGLCFASAEVFLMFGMVFPVMMLMRPAAGAESGAWADGIAAKVAAWLVVAFALYAMMQFNRGDWRHELALAAGAAMMLAGWRSRWLVERLAAGRATGAGGKRRRVKAGRTKGFGGVALMLREVGARGALLVLLALAIMPAVILASPHHGTWNEALAGMYRGWRGVFPPVSVIVITMIAAPRRVRNLRVMPLSSRAIAWTLLGAALLPVMAAYAAVAGVVYLSGGAEPVEIALLQMMFLMAVAAMRVPVYVWFGNEKVMIGALTALLLILLMVPAIVLDLRVRTMPVDAAAVAGLAVLLAVTLAISYRKTLEGIEKCADAYRISEDTAGRAGSGFWGW